MENYKFEVKKNVSKVKGRKIKNNYRAKKCICEQIN